MAQTWTRKELLALMSARHGQREGHGPDAFLTLTIRVTPDLLEAMLGGTWTFDDGRTATFEGVTIGDDGYAEPLFGRHEPGRSGHPGHA